MVDPPSPQDVADELNTLRDGWNAAMGVRFVRATADEVVVEWEIAAQHRQPYGIVHGGVHCGVIETIASVSLPMMWRFCSLANTSLMTRT